MKPLDDEGMQLLKAFERDYRRTKRALLEGKRLGFSGKQTARRDLMALGERLRAIGAGFRRTRRNSYHSVIIDGIVTHSNPFGP